MSRFNKMLHGTASEAAAILGDDWGGPDTTDGEIEELRLGLTNALNRIDLLERKAAHPVPVRGIYTVKAIKVIAFGGLHDLDDEVEGEYTFCAISIKDALDQFHSTVPVEVLDDFDIAAYGPAICGACGTPGESGTTCRKCGGRGVIG